MMLSIWRSVSCRRLAAFAFAILLIFVIIIAISLWVLNVPILRIFNELLDGNQQTTDKIDDSDLPVAEPEDFLRQANGQYLTYHFDDLQDEISDNSNLKQVFQVGSSSNGQRAIIVSLKEDRPSTENSNINNINKNKNNNNNDNSGLNSQYRTEHDLLQPLPRPPNKKSVNTNKVHLLNTPTSTLVEGDGGKSDDHQYNPIKDDDEPIYIDEDEESPSGKQPVQSSSAHDATKDTGANGIEYFDEIISDHQRQKSDKKYKSTDKKDKYTPESDRSGQPAESVSIYTKAENIDPEDRMFSGGDGRDIPIIDNKKISRTLSKSVDVDRDDDDDDYDVHSGSGDFGVLDLPVQQHREIKASRADQSNFKLETNDKNWYSVDTGLTSKRRKNSHRISQLHKNLTKKQLIEQLIEGSRQQRKDARKQHPIAHHFNSYRQSQTTAANSNPSKTKAWFETRARRISGNVKKSEERSRQLLFCEDAGSGELCRMLFKEYGATPVIE